MSERLSTIEKYSALVESWKQNLDQNSTGNSPDANTEFKHMYHRGMTYLACFATAESRDGRQIFSNTRRLRLALQGVAHAVAILQEFISSRRAQPNLPCVHLEYKKATMCIATACILEACMLIPEYIQVVYCKGVIQELTDEIEKEGARWGRETEDSYVTTLKSLLVQLDNSIKKRKYGVSGTSQNLTSKLLSSNNSLGSSTGNSSSIPLSTSAPPLLGDPYLYNDVLTPKCASAEVILTTWVQDLGHSGSISAFGDEFGKVILEDETSEKRQNLQVDQQNLNQAEPVTRSPDTSAKNQATSDTVKNPTTANTVEEERKVTAGLNMEETLNFNYRLWNDEGAQQTIYLPKQTSIKEKTEGMSFGPIDPPQNNLELNNFQCQKEELEQNFFNSEQQIKFTDQPLDLLPSSNIYQSDQLDQIQLMARSSAGNNELLFEPGGNGNNQFQQQQALYQQQQDGEENYQHYVQGQQQGPNSYLVPEQTSTLLESLRNVYPDRTFQVCFQTRS
ncbi:hypothetical protein BY996DRAFT_6417008 [Phakopsora pachyrhizi]|nr:hypothetical protein BY996DRAFT_6417008 [Phakopsora pachyrhizi]